MKKIELGMFGRIVIAILAGVGFGFLFLHSGSAGEAGTRLFNYSEFTLMESRGRWKVDSARSLEQFFALSNSVSA